CTPSSQDHSSFWRTRSRENLFWLRSKPVAAEAFPLDHAISATRPVSVETSTPRVLHSTPVHGSMRRRARARVDEAARRLVLAVAGASELVCGRVKPGAPGRFLCRRR